MNTEESPPYEDRELRGSPWRCPKFRKIVAGMIVGAAILSGILVLTLSGTKQTIGCVWPRCPGNLKQIGLAIETYSSKTFYGVAPPGRSSSEIIRALYDNGNGVLGDLGVFQCRPGKTQVTAGIRCDYLIFPNLSLAMRVNLIVAADKPGNHKDGGFCIYKNGPYRFFKVDLTTYKAWAQAFAMGDIDAARVGPDVWGRKDEVIICLLKEYAAAQVTCKQVDGSSGHYARSLGAMSSLGLLPEAMAAADVAALGAFARPCAGYRFVVITKLGAKPLDYANEFALCAVPSIYNKSGTNTFVVDETGAVLMKDTQGIPVTDLSEVDSTWVVP